MSYTDAFHDYIKDIPMEINRRFYPTANINVDFIQLPEKLVFSKFEYTFEAEKRAREQYDRQNEPTTSVNPEKSKKEEVAVEKKTVRSVSAVPFGGLSQDVLVPVSVNSTPILSKALPLTPNTVSLPHSLHEFESINNVFDDIQISALDDRKALQEVLMSTSGAAAESSSSVIVLNNNLEKSAVPTVEKEKEKPKDNNEELRKRLLTKGFRKDIVEKALSSLPKSRLVHIEYYMKACRTVEKTGRCSIDEMLPFLVDSNLTDKKVILAYSESAAALLKMGFERKDVFAAVAAENGDQTKAVNRLLPS